MQRMRIMGSSTCVASSCDAVGLELTALQHDSEVIDVDTANIDFAEGDDLTLTAQKIAAITFAGTGGYTRPAYLSGQT